MSNKFKSIHIDLEKRIYELNGEKMKDVRSLMLYLDGKKWGLRINKDETFEGSSRYVKE